ncbi:MAG: hemolysin family protein [Acidimicrobiales bacterium]
MTEMWPFVMIVVLLAVNGFFVAFEFALVGSRRSRLEPMAAAGDRSAGRALFAMKELSIQLAGAQLGITVASLVLGLVGGLAVVEVLEPLAQRIAFIPDGWTHSIATILGLLIIVFAHMVIGEMIPKNLTLTSPESVLKVLTGPNRLYLFIARPLLIVLNWFGNVGIRLCGVEPKDELSDLHSAKELALLVSVSQEEGAIPDFSAELLSGVLDFSLRTVASVMVQREFVAAASVSATPNELAEMIQIVGHTRLLLVGESGIDDVQGFLHTKDLLAVLDHDLDIPLSSRLVRRPLVTGREESLEILLERMQSTQVHFAVVANDDESTAGIVTLDDLLEELLSELTDEPLVNE